MAGVTSLATRLSQPQGDSRFSFPSVFLLIHLSSDSPSVLRLHSDQMLGPRIEGRTWWRLDSFWGSSQGSWLCAQLQSICTVQNERTRKFHLAIVRSSDRGNQGGRLHCEGLGPLSQSHLTPPRPPVSPNELPNTRYYE